MPDKVVKYEIMYIISADLKDADKFREKLEAPLLENEGKITKNTDMGVKEFAYPINHKNKGHYVLLEVSTTAASIEEFKRRFALAKGSVRHMIINLNEEKQFKIKKTREPKEGENNNGYRRNNRPRFNRYQDNRNRPYVRRSANSIGKTTLDADNIKPNVASEADIKPTREKSEGSKENNA